MPAAARRLLFEAVLARAQRTQAETFAARGYTQTKLPAAKGGKPNLNGFRFRNESMPALAASFANAPFVTAHDWGDVRARGGTVTDSRVEETDDAVGLLFVVDATAAWAQQGLADGTIDRFSIGAEGTGEIVCTVHGSPVWTECFCWPLMSVDGKVAEWEYEGAVGRELSAVNVPAVDGTGIVMPFSAAPPSLVDLALLCGRERPVGDAPVHAQLERDLAAARAENLRMHVDHAIARLAAEREIPDPLVATLRATAQERGRDAFDRELVIVRAASLARVAAGGAPRARAVLQSDARAVVDATAARPDGYDVPDAYEQHRDNPELHRLMRMCGLTVENVRHFGPRQFRVVVGLREAIEATEERERSGQ